MVKRGRRRVITIPKAEDLLSIKKDELIPKKKTEEEKAEELRKAEELEKKEKEEKLKRLQDFKEYEKQKLESIQKNKENNYDPYEGSPKINYKNDEDQPIIYGDFLNNVSTENEDALVVKTYDEIPNEIPDGKDPSEFTYEAHSLDFKQSLKDFFKDIPATLDFDDEEIKPHRIEKIEMDINKIEKAETITSFNNHVKELMLDRNKKVTPQSYKQNKEELIKDTNTNINININIENKALPNRNIKVASSRRSTNPVSKRSNKVSSNRTIF